MKWTSASLSQIASCFLLVAHVVGCGGSGGSGSSEFAHSPNSITYDGLTSQAVLGRNNLSKFSNLLFGSNSSQSSAKSSQPGIIGDLDGVRANISRLQRYLLLADVDASDLSSKFDGAQREIETEPCELAGTVDTETFSPGEFKLHFSDCVDASGVKTNGTVNLSYEFIETIDFLPRKVATFSFSDYFLESGSAEIEISGRVKIIFFTSTCEDRYRYEITTRDTATLEVTRYVNFEYLDICSGYDENAFSFEGDIYLSDEGYVHIYTRDKLIEQDTNQNPFPDKSGILRISGLASRVEIETYDRYDSRKNLDYDPLGGGGTFSRLRLMSFRFDNDGDDIDDFVLTWPVVGSAPFAARGSFADSDGDMMLDVWEDYHELASSDPGDATADPDADGFSNLQEYRGFSDPSNQQDIPFFNGTFSATVHNSNQAVVRKGEDFIFTVLTQTMALYLPQRYWVDLYLSNNAELIDPSGIDCGPDPADAARKLCPINITSLGVNEGTNDRLQNYAIRSLDDAPISIELQFRIEPLIDTDGFDNKINLNVSFL